MWIVLFFIFILVGKSSSLLGATHPGDEFDFSKGRPPAEQLETVARITLAENTESTAHYKGMNLFIETRDKITKRYLWFADVKFQPDNKSPSTLGGTFSCYESRVKVNYYTASQYFEGKHVISKASPPVSFHYCKRDTYDLSTGQYKNYYKYLLARSILEFTLKKEKVLELTDLYDVINGEGMKITINSWFAASSKELPKYSTLGYAHRQKAWNCAVFSSALLQELGVNLCEHSDVIRKFIRFEYGDLKESTFFGSIIGGGIGFTLGGPLGFAAGIAGGGVMFFGGKAGTDSFFHRAYPWIILDEIINNHAVLNIRPKFVIPASGHAINNSDAIYVTRRSLIEDSPNKYEKWYDLFLGQKATLNNHVVIYSCL